MKIKYNGTFYHRITFKHFTASEYFISKENNIIRRKLGIIYGVKPKISNGVKCLETAIAGTYDAKTKTAQRKVKTYNQIYASVFYKGKKWFALMEVKGIPTMFSKTEFTKVTAPRLAEFKGLVHDSNCAIRQCDLVAIKTHKDNGKSLKKIGDMFNCSPTSVARALKRKIK